MKTAFAPIPTDSCIVSIKYANVVGSKIPPTNYSTYQISEVKSITEKRTSFQKSIEFKSWTTLATQYIVPDTIYLYFLQLVYASNSLRNIRTMSPCPISQMNFSIISIQLSTASHSILLSATTESIPKSVQSSITIISAPLSCNTPLTSLKEHPCGTSPSQSNWTSHVFKVNKSTSNSPVHSIQPQSSVYEYVITQHAITIFFTQLQIAAYSGFFSERGVAGYTTDLWRIPFDSYLKSQITLRTSSENFISLTKGFYPDLHPGLSIFIFTEKKRSLQSINTDFSITYKEYASIVRTITHLKSNSSCRTGEPKYLTEGICTSPQSTEPLPCNTMADQQFISNSHSTSSFSSSIFITSISTLAISRVSFSIIPMQILSSAVCYNPLLSSPTDMNSKIERSSIFIISAIFPSQMSPMHSTKYLRKTWGLHSIYTNSTYHTKKIISFLKVYQTQIQTSAYTHLTVEQLRGSSSTPSLNAVYSALYSVSWLLEYGTEFAYIRSMSCGTGQEVAFENSTQAVYAYYYPSDSIHKYTREKITSWWTNSSSWIKSIESTGSSCSGLSFPILKSTQMKIDFVSISTDSCIVSIKYANVVASKIRPTNYSTYQISEVKSITEKRTSFQKSIEFKSWSISTTQYIAPDTIYLYFLQLVYASNSLSNIRTMSPCAISQMNFSIISIQLSTASHSILLSTTTESIPKSVQSSITILSAPLSCNPPLSSSKEHPCGTSPSQSNWTSPVCNVNKSTLNSPVHSIQPQPSVYEYLITQHAIGISFTQLQIAAYSGFFSVRGVAGYTTDLWRIPFDSYLKSQITLRTSSQNFISLTNGFYPGLQPGFSIFIFTEKKRSLESINTDFSTMHKEYASIVRTITYLKSNSSCRTLERKYLTEGICTSPQSTEPLPCNTMANQQFISNSHSTSSFSSSVCITSISTLVISRISFSIIQMQILSSTVCYNPLLSSPTDMNSKIERSSIFIISAIFPSQMSPMHSTKYLRKTWGLHSIYTNSTYHTKKIISFLKVYQTQIQTSAYTHLTLEQLRGSSSTPCLYAPYSVSWLVEYGTEFPYIRSMSCGTGQEVAFENSTQAVYAYYYPSDSIHKYTREKITSWWTNTSSWIKSIESTGSSCSGLSFPIFKSTQMKIDFVSISTDSCIVSIKYANVVGSKVPPTNYSTYQISEVKSITEKRTSFQKSIEFKSWTTLATQYIVPDTIYLYFLQLVYASNSLSNIRTISPCPISQMNFSIISIQFSTASHSILLSTTSESIPKSVQSSITIISAPLSCNTPLTPLKEHPCGTSPSQSNWTSPVCKVNKSTLNSPVHSIQPQTSVYEYLITQHAITISFTQLLIAAYSGFSSERSVAGYTIDLWRIPFDSYFKSQIALRTSSENFISLTNGFYPDLHPGFSIFMFTEKKRSLESINTDFSVTYKEYASIVRTITHPKSNSSCRTGEPKNLTEGICTSPQSTEPLPCNTMADQQFISNSHCTSSFSSSVCITGISTLVISRISFSIIPMQILSSAVCYNPLLSSPTDMNSKIERSSIFIISAIFPSQMSPMHSTKYLRKTWGLHSIYTNSTYHTGKILSFLKVYQTQTQTSAYTHLTIEQLRGSSSTPSRNAVYSALYSVSWLVEYGTEFAYIRSMSCSTGQEVAFENSTRAIYAYYYPSDSIHKYTREKITWWWTNSSSWIKSIESTGSSCSELSFTIFKSTQMKIYSAPISTDSCIVSIKYANVVGSNIPPTNYSTYQISEVKWITEKRTSFQKSIEFKSWSTLTTHYIVSDTIYLYFLQLVYASNFLSNIRTMSLCPISQMNFSIISIQLSTASHSILLSTTTESIPKSVQSSITILSAPLSCKTPLSSSEEYPCGTSPSQSNWTSPVCKVIKSTLNSPVHSAQSQTSVYEYLITQHAIGISFTQLQIAAYSGFFS
ncbi:mucin-3A-like, partial [Hermetia illucens]|uniref:mucin-3A-like n=1 Tax=Hermetia illucens TaxID=343691 RepID=UPI0018CC0B5B